MCRWAEAKASVGTLANTENLSLETSRLLCERKYGVVLAKSDIDYLTGISWLKAAEYLHNKYMESVGMKQILMAQMLS